MPGRGAREMSETERIPEVKEIVGAMLFAAKKPLTAGDIRRVLQQVAVGEAGAAADFGSLKTADVQAGIDELVEQVNGLRLGFAVRKVANGYRLENEVRCGPWLRQLLEKGRSSRLSRPALETLAIIAYRQPCLRSEIEQVRGVAVDQIIRNLLEMQLIRVVGRSDLPGRPWLFGTTQRFLEHFGLNSVDDMPAVEELKKLGELAPRRAGPAGGDAEDETAAEADAADDMAAEEDAAVEAGTDDADDGGAGGDPEAWDEDAGIGRIDLAGDEAEGKE